MVGDGLTGYLEQHRVLIIKVLRLLLNLIISLVELLDSGIVLC